MKRTVLLASACYLMACSGVSRVSPKTIEQVKAIVDNAKVMAMVLRGDHPNYAEVGKGDFPLWTFLPREGGKLHVISNKPNCVLWLSGPIQPVHVGLTLPVYARPDISLPSNVARWDVAVEQAWGWVVMQALTIEGNRILISNAIVVRVGP